MAAPLLQASPEPLRVSQLVLAQVLAASGLGQTLPAEPLARLREVVGRSMHLLVPLRFEPAQAGRVRPDAAQQRDLAGAGLAQQQQGRRRAGQQALVFGPAAGGRATAGGRGRFGRRRRGLRGPGGQPPALQRRGGVVAPLRKAVVAWPTPALQPLAGSKRHGMQRRDVGGQRQAQPRSFDLQGLRLAPDFEQLLGPVKVDAQGVQRVGRCGVGPEDQRQRFARLPLLAAGQHHHQSCGHADGKHGGFASGLYPGREFEQSA